MSLEYNDMSLEYDEINLWINNDLIPTFLYKPNNSAYAERI